METIITAYPVKNVEIGICKNSIDDRLEKDRYSNHKNESKYQSYIICIITNENINKGDIYYCCIEQDIFKAIKKINTNSGIRSRVIMTSSKMFDLPLIDKSIISEFIQRHNNSDKKAFGITLKNNKYKITNNV